MIGIKRVHEAAAQGHAAGRLEFLDSLRAWAALYVVIYHTALIPTPGLHVPVWAAPVIMTGGTGVTLFFVASAFSLCHAARHGEQHGRELAAFAIRRFFRIAPLFYAVLMVSVVRDLWLFSVWHGPGAIITNAVFLFNLWPGHEAGIVWASWTIGVEMLFYAGFPFVVFRISTVARAMVLVIGLLMVAAGWNEALRRSGLPATAMEGQAQFGVLRFLPMFALGMLVYRLFERFVERHAPGWKVGGALIVGALYLYVELISGKLRTTLFVDVFYWQGILYSALVLGVSIWPVRLFVNRITQHIGKVSYSLYLLHPMVVYALAPIYHIIEAQGWLPTLTFGLCASVTLGIAIALSTVTYTLIEHPGMRLGRRIASRVARGATLRSRTTTAV